MDERKNVKQTIMEVSLALFSEKGFEGVSVSELTAAAGITKPTLYYYFGSKEGVFDAVCRVNYARLNALIDESAVYHAHPESYYEDIFSTLTRVTSAYFLFASKNESFYRLTMANLTMPRSSPLFALVRKYHFAQYETLGNMFREMARPHSNLRGKDKQLTWAFIGAINTYIGLMFYGLSEREFDDNAIRDLVRLFMHGIYS